MIPALERFIPVSSAYERITLIQKIDRVVDVAFRELSLRGLVKFKMITARRIIF